MKLRKLLENIEYKIIARRVEANLESRIASASETSLESEVENLTSDSRKVTKNTTFVCIVGAVSDGHKYIQEVIEKGVNRTDLKTFPFPIVIYNFIEKL